MKNFEEENPDKMTKFKAIFWLVKGNKSYQFTNLRSLSLKISLIHYVQQGLNIANKTKKTLKSKPYVILILPPTVFLDLIIEKNITLIKLLIFYILKKENILFLGIRTIYRVNL
jgi:hypothetical protein